MDQNYNNYNGYGGDPNTFYNPGQNPMMQQQMYQQQIPPIPPQQPKKKGKFAKAVALVAAVAIVGAGTGYIGASVASSGIGIYNSRGNITASYDNNGETEKPARAGDEDVSSALNAIASSGSGTADKIYPSDVTPTGVNGTYTADELYAAVNDTIVLVKVYTEASASSGYYYYDYYFGYTPADDSKTSDEPVLSGYGSGIVFTEDGYILTNAHVVKGAAKLVVEVNDYYDSSTTYEYEAKIIGSDESTDIAVIKIERDEKFVAAKIGDSDSLRVGQDICVIGNPGINADIMFAHTLTRGVVSGLNVQCLADNGYSLSLIQTDAAINSGNSGGGMFDMYGNVVGVVNSKIIATTYEGLGFALTINEAKPIMQDLLTYGFVKSRPVLGITTIELNEYRAQLYGAKLSRGLLVASISENAPVATSGLRTADIITKINGQNVETVADVQSILSKFKVGDTVTATVARATASGGVDSIDIDIILTESSNG